MSIHLTLQNKIDKQFGRYYDTAEKVSKILKSKGKTRESPYGFIEVEMIKRIKYTGNTHNIFKGY